MAADDCEHDEAIEELRLDVARLDSNHAKHEAEHREIVSALRRDVDRLERRTEDSGRHELSKLELDYANLVQEKRARETLERADAAAKAKADRDAAAAVIAAARARRWDLFKLGLPLVLSAVGGAVIGAWHTISAAVSALFHSKGP